MLNLGDPLIPSNLLSGDEIQQPVNAHLLDPPIGRGTNVGKVLILIIRKEVSREIGMGKRRAVCVKKL